MDYEEYLKQNPEFAARQKAKLSVNISVPENNHNKRISPSTTAIALYIFGWIIYNCSINNFIFRGYFCKKRIPQI